MFYCTPSLPPHTGLRLFAACAAYWCVVWFCLGLGWVVGFVVRRRLAGFWVLQSVRQGFPGVSWAILAGTGAVPAGPGPPPCCREAVLRPKAAQLAFVVVVFFSVCVFVCWVWVGFVVCFLWLCTIDRKKCAHGLHVNACTLHELRKL